MAATATSFDHVNGHEKRIDEEVVQLLSDIRRIGEEPGSPHVKFGELFDDDDVQQYYEALVGTLKTAKKRGVVNFKGQMLLKGMHDNVVITIAEEAEKKLLTSSSSTTTNVGNNESMDETQPPVMTDES